LEKGWSNLNHPDRFVQYAARVAVEHQPVATWKARALSEKNPTSKIQAILALAHQGTNADAASMLNSLMQVDYAALSSTDKQNILRTIEVILARYDQGATASKAQLVAYLDRHYPAE